MCAVLAMGADAKTTVSIKCMHSRDNGQYLSFWYTAWPLCPASTDKVSYFSLYLYLPSCNWQGELFLSKSLSALLQLKRWASFYIRSFSLNKCIGIVGVRKYLGCPCVCLSFCVCVCASVCKCVCLSICGQPCAVTTMPISTKLYRNGPSWV